MPRLSCFEQRTPCRRPQGTRAFIALGLSLGVHFILVESLAIRHPAGDIAAPGALPLVATLQAAADSPPAGTALTPEALHTVTVAKAPAAPRTVPDEAVRERRESARPARRKPEESSIASADPPQPQLAREEERYYGAHELDVYPSLRQPLRTALQSIAAEKFLLLVSLDQAGAVEEVSLIEGRADSAIRTAVEDLVRHALFFPGRKDGRAVKSRIAIGIAWHAADAGSAQR